MKRNTFLLTICTKIVIAMLVCVFMFQNASAQECPPEMLSYWKLDKGSGNIAYDTIGNKNGIINGGSWENGQVGGAIKLDGTGDYIGFGDLGMDTSAFSIALWFKTDNWIQNGRTSGALISNDYCYWCNPSKGWLMWIYIDTFWFTVNHNNSLTGVQDVDYKDKWTFLVFTKDEKGQTKMYFNGIETTSYVDQTPWVDPYFPFDQKIDVGRRADEGWYFKGSIDEVAIFQEALSPEDIELMFQNSLNGNSYCVSEPPSSFPDDKTVPAGAVHAYDNMIWPPNNKMVSVNLSGYVFDELSSTRDEGGIGISSAYLLVDGEEIILKNETINLLGADGTFSLTIDVKAKKDTVYHIELFAADTVPENPNLGMVDKTLIRVPENMSRK